MGAVGIRISNRHVQSALGESQESLPAPGVHAFSDTQATWDTAARKGGQGGTRPGAASWDVYDMQEGKLREARLLSSTVLPKVQTAPMSRPPVPPQPSCPMGAPPTWRP